MRIMKILGLSLAALSIATIATAPASARHRHQVCHWERHHGHNLKVCHWAH